MLHSIHRFRALLISATFFGMLLSSLAVSGEPFQLIVAGALPGTPSPANWKDVYRFSIDGTGGAASPLASIHNGQVSDPWGVAFRSSRELLIGDRQATEGAGISRFLLDPDGVNYTYLGRVIQVGMNNVAGLSCNPLTGELFAGEVYHGLYRFSFDGDIPIFQTVFWDGLTDGNYHDLCLSPTGDKLLLVGNSNKIRQYSISSDGIMVRLPNVALPDAGLLSVLAFRPNGELYVADNANHIFRFRLDENWNLIPRGSLIVNDGYGIAFSPDGQEMFVAKHASTGSGVYRFAYQSEEDTWSQTDFISTPAAGDIGVFIPNSTPPTIDITSPTSESSYTTDQESISLVGTASGNQGYTFVTWINDRGGMGQYSGSGTWSFSDVPLQLGNNKITVITRDASGLSATDTLEVQYTPKSYVVYSNDFESSAGAEWSATTIEQTPLGGRRFLGRFANGNVSLDLSNLPVHDSVLIEADLYVIQSWDGNCVNGNAGGIVGPDRWGLSVAGGPILLDTTFALYPYADSHGGQAYPGRYPGGSYPGRTGAVENNTLGYIYNDSFYPNNPSDSVYKLSYVVPHTSDSIRFSFSGSGLESVANESWGLDNVRVSLGVHPQNCTVGSAKSAASQLVEIADAVVTDNGVQPGSVFIESTDRSGGIRVVTGETLAVGQRVHLYGKVDRIDGEYQIHNVTFVDDVSGSEEVDPVGVNTKEIGNDPREMLDYTGLDLTGMLVRFAGTVKGTITSQRIIYVDDGRSYQDGIGPVTGIRVHVPVGITMPAKYDNVIVSGILRVEKHVLTGWGEVNGDWYEAGTTVYVPSAYIRGNYDLDILP